MNKPRGRQHGLDISFLQSDLFDSRLDQSFDYILDRGCCHIFPRQMRAQYPAAIASLLKPGGPLLLKYCQPCDPVRI
ncbi:MAG: methyltransferase domain-containing protein [Thermoleophilia bacterium]